ncbi:DedA family protein [soil metagenome]
MSAEILIARYGLAAVFLGAGIEGETMVVTGGVLAHEGLLPWLGVAIAASAGSFVADQIFFAAGRRFRDTRRVRRMIARPNFTRAMEMFERHQTGFVLGFRFLYGLRTVSPIAIGTSHIRSRDFWVLNAISATAWGFLFSGLGFVFGNAITGIFGKLHPGRILLPALAAAVVGVAIFQGVRWLRAARQ